MKLKKFMKLRWILKKNKADGTKERSCFLKNAQLLLTVVAVFVGIGIGFGLRETHPSQKTIDLIAFPGEILMSMLKMMILPLIAASLISGLSQIDAKQSGKIGIVSLGYYAVTLTLSVITGIALVLLIHPGHADIKHMNAIKATEEDKQHVNISAFDKIMDLIRNMFPENIMRAMFSQVETKYSETVAINAEGKNISTLKLQKHFVEGIDVLGIIVFSIVLGIVISYVGEEAQPLAKLFVALDVVITQIVILIMWYAPIGIASLIASKILEIEDLGATAKMLGAYVGTVMAGLAIHLFITEQLVYLIATRKNPFTFLKGLTHAAVTALGTSSSAASLPVTFRCLEINNRVNPKYTKFVLPVGAMVNMDGTALYEAVSAIFIAQMNGMELDFGQLVVVCITALLAAIGAASIPSAGLVTMLMVLSSVGLPLSDISLIIAVDWLLDRFRTCVNVCGDGFGCGVVEAICESLGGAEGLDPKDVVEELEDYPSDIVSMSSVEEGTTNNFGESFASNNTTTILIRP
uniref:Amino acid transporter n=1 Tax=Panagrolaimus sp. PS1159 TaxID=55785 RepID=A0AC35F1B5_9BILA